MGNNSSGPQGCLVGYLPGRLAAPPAGWLALPQALSRDLGLSGGCLDVVQILSGNWPSPKLCLGIIQIWGSHCPGIVRILSGIVREIQVLPVEGRPSSTPGIPHQGRQQKHVIFQVNNGLRRRDLSKCLRVNALDLKTCNSNLNP